MGHIMAADLSVKKANFISNCITAATQMAALRTTMLGLKDQWNDVGYAVDAANPILDSDCAGSNKHLVAQNITDFISFQGTLETTWGQGYGAYIEKMVP
jgi:hypothetical protein